MGSSSRMLRGISKGIGVSRMSFDCSGDGSLVRSFGLRIRPNVHVTVMNPAKYKGAAFVGLLVHFCSISSKGVYVSNGPVSRVSQRSLEGDFNVILRSA